MQVEENFGDAEADTKTQTEETMPDVPQEASFDSDVPEVVEDTSASSDAGDTIADENSGSEQKPDAVEESGVSEHLLNEARNVYGFTDDDLGGYQTDDDLSRSLGAIDRLAMQRFSPQQEQQFAQQQPPAQPQQQAPPPQAQPQQGDGEQWLPKKLDLDLSDEFEPEVHDLLNKINDHYHGQLEEAHKNFDGRLKDVDEFTLGMQESQMAAYERQMDDYFDSLPDAYKEHFGGGRMVDLAPNSPQWTNRRQWEQDYHTQAAMDYQSGRQPGTFDEYKDRVLRARWGNVADDLTRQDMRSQAANQRRKAINRPSSRTAKKATGTERAVDNMDEFYRSRGMDVYNAQERFEEVI